VPRRDICRVYVSSRRRDNRAGADRECGDGSHRSTNATRNRVSRHISQEVCPWNVKFARDVTEPALAPRAEIADVTLDEWAAMDEAEWKARTQGTAIRRAKRDGFVRNARAANASHERDGGT